MRVPRVISPNSPLQPYCREKALGQLLLWLMETNQHSLIMDDRRREEGEKEEERGEEEVQIMTTFQRAVQEPPLRLALLMTNQRLLLLNINDLTMPSLIFSVDQMKEWMMTNL